MGIERINTLKCDMGFGSQRRQNDICRNNSEHSDLCCGNGRRIYLRKKKEGDRMFVTSLLKTSSDRIKIFSGMGMTLCQNIDCEQTVHGVRGEFTVLDITKESLYDDLDLAMRIGRMGGVDLKASDVPIIHNLVEIIMDCCLCGQDKRIDFVNNEKRIEVAEVFISH